MAPAVVSRGGIRRDDVGTGIGMGLLLPLVGFQALMQTRTVVTDAALAGLVLLPVASAALWCAFSRRRPRPFGPLVGAMLGSIALPAVVIGFISGLAWMLSDPG